MFFKVRARSDPVDYGEKTAARQRCKNAVPSAFVEIDGLARVSEEGLRCGIRVFGCNNEEGIKSHRDKRLTAIRMAFDQVESKGKRAQLSFE